MLEDYCKIFAGAMGLLQIGSGPSIKPSRLQGLGQGWSRTQALLLAALVLGTASSGHHACCTQLSTMVLPLSNQTED